MRLHLTTLLLSVALLAVGASWISNVIHWRQERNALHDEMRRAKQALRQEYLASEAICRTEAMNACLSNFEPESRSRRMLVNNVIALFYWEEFLATKLETELESSTVSNLRTRLKVATEKALELIGDDSDGFKYEVPYWDEEKLSSFLKNKNKVSRKQE